MLKTLIADTLIVVGAGLITAGLWRLSPAAALIFLGMFVAVVGYLVGRE